MLIDDYKKKFGDVLCWSKLTCKILGITRSRHQLMISEGTLTPYQEEGGTPRSFTYHKLRDILNLREERVMRNKVRPRSPGGPTKIATDEEVILALEQAFEHPHRNFLLSSIYPGLLKRRRNV